MTSPKPQIHLFLSLLVGLLLTGISGCAPSGPSPAVTQRLAVTESFAEKIQSMTDCIGEVTDVDSFLAQKPKVMEIIGSVEEMVKELPSLPELEDGEKEKYSAEFAAARSKVEAAIKSLTTKAKEAQETLTKQPFDQQIKIMPAIMELQPKLTEIGKSLEAAKEYFE